MNANGTMAGSDEIERLIQAFDLALGAHRYQGALGIYRQLTVVQALAEFHEAGIELDFPVSKSGDEHIGLIAAAATEAVDGLGDGATNALRAASISLSVVMLLQQSLDSFGATQSGQVAEKLAKCVLDGIAVGQADSLATTVRLGFISRTVGQDRVKERQQEAAAYTNSQLAEMKQRALAEAIRIAETNPALSNEDLACLVRDAAKTPRKIRTMTDWVRRWRSSGTLSPLRQPR